MAARAVLAAGEASLAAKVEVAREAAAQVAVWQAELVAAVRACLSEPMIDRPRAYLAYQLGLVPAEIDQILELCDRLTELPRVTELLASGERSLGTVSAIARRADPVNEAVLVEKSKALTAGALVRMLRDYDRVRAPSDRDNFSAVHDPADAPSTVTIRRRPDGRHRVTLDLDAADAAELGAALDAAVRRRSDQAVEHDPRSEPIDRARGAAFMDLLTDARRRDSDPDGYAADAVQSTLIIHATDSPDGLHLEGAVLDGDTIPHWMTAMLVERGDLTAIVAVAGQPLIATVPDRYATRTQRRALIARDRACTFPGCGSTRGLIAHHITHADRGGPTRLDNLTLLCRHHHRTVHRHHLTHDGTWRYPDHQPVQPHTLRRPPTPRPATQRRKGSYEPLTTYARDVLLHTWLTHAA